MTLKRLTCLLLVAILMLGALSGCKAKPQKAIALTIGEHEITAVELNYYYVEMIDSFYQDYAYIISTMLDVKKPLSQQIFDETTGQTWADYFLQCSIENAKSTYALCDAAEAAGFTLGQAQQDSVDLVIDALKGYAQSAGQEVDDCMEELYCKGANVESYREYYRRNMLANSYYSYYYSSLEYSNEALFEFDRENMARFNSYSYALYYLPVSKFASDAEAKAAAERVQAGSYNDAAAFNEALASLAGQTDAKATEYTNQLHTTISTDYSDWLSGKERKVGDVGIFPSLKDSVAEGYYLLLYLGTENNRFRLKNVRHILITPEGGTYNPLTGKTEYSIREMAGAAVQAKAILEQWDKFNMPTEDYFASLANQFSDDGDGSTGGLYENVYPGMISTAFTDWCYDEERQPGDVEPIETEYGYHIMYFVGNSTMTYRNYLITAALRERDTTAWYDALLESYTVTEKDLSFVDLDRALHTNA